MSGNNGIYVISGRESVEGVLKLLNAEFKILSIPASSIKKNLWIRLTHDVERQFRMELSKRTEIGDGQILGEILEAKFSTPANLDKRLIVIGSKDGTLTAETFNNPTELLRREMQSTEVNQEMFVFVDTSVSRFMNRPGKKPPLDDTVYESLQSDAKKPETLPAKIMENLTDLEVTEDMKQALMRTFDLLSAETEVQAKENQLVKKKLEKRLSDKDKMIESLGAECEAQIKANQELQQVESQRLMKQAQQTMQQKEKEIEDCKQAREQFAENNKELIDRILQAREEAEEEYNLKKENAVFEGEEAKLSAGVRGGVIPRKESFEAMTDQEFVSWYNHQNQLINAASQGVKKGSGWNKKGVDRIKIYPDYPLSEGLQLEKLRSVSESVPKTSVSDMSVSDYGVPTANSLDEKKARPVAIMELKKLPNLSKLGIAMYNENSGQSIIEHLGSLLTTFQFKLASLEDEEKKSIVSQSLPPSMSWIYGNFSTQDSRTADTLIKAIARLTVGNSTQVADELLKVKKRVSEDPLSYHQRLMAMCQFIKGSGSERMAFQVIRQKIEEILQPQAKMELRRRLEALQETEMTVAKIGKELVAIRTFLGKDRMMAAEKPSKEWENEISQMHSGFRKNNSKSKFGKSGKFNKEKPSNDKKVGKCFYCGHEGHWKKDCRKFMNRNQGRSGKQQK